MIVGELKKEIKTHREKVNQSLQVKTMLQKMQTTGKLLKSMYEELGRSAKYEGKFFEGKDVYTLFYDRLRDINNYFWKFSDSVDELTVPYDREVPLICPIAHFTGEEGYGRFLDLHGLHSKYVNSKFGFKCDYIEYLKNEAWMVHGLPRGYRVSKLYRAYLFDLLGYLEGFYHRSQPLSSLDKIYKKVIVDFDMIWSMGKVPGWEDQHVRAERKNIESRISVMDHTLTSIEDLESLGSDRIKLILQTMGVKYGGCIRKKVDRLWMIGGKPLAHLERRLLARGLSGSVFCQSERNLREVALNEIKLLRLSWELRYVINDSLTNIEKKLTKTSQELEAEIEEEIADLPVENEDDNDDYIYNPLNLPLGPDGEPIPYWLYKLHGLNRKFECEICGNHTYEGRRGFEKHFKEPRHQQGMQALGIPNTKIFFEVTKIEDAVKLWKSVESRHQLLEGNGPDKVQEFEDADGNVYDKSTYELLHKQGLI
jgi:splicing factor 3A subunit 3